MQFLIEIIDCLSSFVKSTNQHIVQRLIELDCIQCLLVLLSSIPIDAIDLCYSVLRCLRSFFLPQISYSIISHVDYSNPFLNPLPFVLLCDQDMCQPPVLTNSNMHENSQSTLNINSPVNILCHHVEQLDTLVRLLSTSSIGIQSAIIEILCCLCIDHERQKLLFEKQLVSIIMNLLCRHVQHIR
jgi:hypothetical protein